MNVQFRMSKLAIILPFILLLCGGAFLVFKNTWPRWETLAVIAQNGDIESLEEYLKMGTTVNRKNILTNETLLSIALNNGNLEFCKFLFENGYHLKAINGKDQTTILGRIDLALYTGFPVLDKDDINSNVREEKAVKSRNRHNFYINYVRLVQEYVDDPFTRAIALGNIDLVGQLIESGTDINKPDWYGFLPLTAAVFHEEINIIDLLIKARSSGDGKLIVSPSQPIEITGSAHKIAISPMIAACMIGNERILEILIDAGGNIDEIDYFGYSPLSVAALWGNRRAFKLLIERGADRDLIIRNEEIEYYIQRGQATKDDEELMMQAIRN